MSPTPARLPKMVDRATLDRKDFRLLFDGEPFPYFIHEPGPRVEPIEGVEELSILWVPVLVESVEVIE